MQSLCFPLTPYSNSRIALFVIATLLNEKQKRYMKVKIFYKDFDIFYKLSFVVFIYFLDNI